MVWRRLLGLWNNERPDSRESVNMAAVVDQARRDWLYAQNYYKTVTDPDLVDYAAFLIKAYERRYIYLLKKARQEGFYYPNGMALSGIMDAGTVRQVP
ncbi:hypothetical protein SATMO3_58970 [Sporomusa aerivorans]